MPARKPNQPNILYIHSHDMGRYVQPYGHAIPTPNIQKLAEEGVLFRNAFSTACYCSPSRAGMLIGTYPHCNGMYGLAHAGWSCNDYGQYLVNTLKKAGYTAALAGVQHIEGVTDQPWKTIGYDQCLDPPAWQSRNEDSRKARGPYAPHEWANSFLDEGPPEPFFLSVGFNKAHRPYLEQPTEDPRYTLPPVPFPDVPQIRMEMARYKTFARDVDEMMGSVFDTLERTRLAKNTLVICTTDHGIDFPRMKGTLSDQGIGVMLIMRGPEGFTGGKVVDGLVSQIDVYPTLCELLGIDPPDWLQGVSFLPVIRDGSSDVRSEVFAENNYGGKWCPIRCVRTKRWKYIRNYDPSLRSYLRSHVGDGHNDSSRFLMEHRYWDVAPSPQEELYDVMFDPCEVRNLAEDPAFAQPLERMRTRLDQWMQETQDPFLTGDFPKPSKRAGE